ncbi:DUF2786 domain-containing protein [Streptomyces sp. NPDC020667]|uniref:DUF2786 domain-containing protein n=1 Tax=Streptomyces sp. NPDC020667 TaxID=3154895 RepID=UPI0033D9082C
MAKRSDRQQGRPGGSPQQPPGDDELLAGVETALAGLRGLSEDALDDAVYAAASALAASPAGPAGVGRALLRAAARTLRRAWEGGWQPADVVRLARRELTAAEVRFTVDAVAAEARRYAPDTLGARWAAQLRDLDARVWWETDDAFLDGFAARERIGRFETVACALGALRLAGGLPRIGAAGPLPGAGHRPAGAPAAPPRMLARIRALLAKAESTEFAEEAEALSAKAQQLMARHSMDEALLAASVGPDGPDGPAACRIGVEGPYESAKALLLDAVAAANHCRSVWSSDYDFSTVVGFEADLELVELMYTSLLVQATTAMARAGDAHHARGRSRRTRDFRQSFLIAYAARIRDRLTLAARTEEATETSVLPVLAAREVAVGETAERLFPTTSAHRLRGRDAEGWARGEEAADGALLG